MFLENWYLERNTCFIGSSEDYKSSKVVMIGAPMDFTTSFRPGARQGPERIRTTSYVLEEYSVYLNKSLNDFTYYDAGDIIMPCGNILESLKRIGTAVEALLCDDKFPLLFGGEHLVSLPVIEKIAKKYTGLTVLHFDAHADLRAEYMGERYSHATVMRRVVEIIGGNNLYQFGIRSGDRDEIEFGHKNTNIYINQLIEPLEKISMKLKDKPIYITLDIDIVDPAFAPGTGTPEPAGVSSREILEALYLLKDLNVVGMDIVEVSPVYDQSERTSILAAKLAREAILQWGK